MSRIPLLLLPGTLCNHRLWAHQVLHLSDIAQPMVMDVGSHPSTESQARQLLQQAPSRFALAGLSYGGILALEVMRQAPERISHLALLNTNARPDIPENEASRRRQLQHAQRQGLESLLRETLIPLYLHEDNRDNSPLIQTIVDMAVACGMEVFYNQLEAVRTRADSRPTLGAIHCPTLVLGGKEDVICNPDRHQEMAEEIPDARLVLLERCGHLSTLEQPEVVTAELRAWLSR
ncbi:alpha/beta fold hydrolase [Zobellella maritima]|uniref:alpha/beta fold hydrolase n=1 Tax=Zobellella maritima TaxID=2059725 RepID=UPI000E3067F6|nr:alpha/beta fold hydrolase [Zobellella maritima]